MPPSPQLQKWQRNQIFETIQRIGLDPREFDFKDADAAVRIKHKWSESYFIVGGNAGHYTGRYLVGDATDWPYDSYSWQNLITRVSRWLEEVKLDLETPDLWAELQREAELLGYDSKEVTNNTPFTPDEQTEIVERLREMAQYVRGRYSLSEEQMRVLDAKIDYLIDAAGRLGRTDWRGVFVGVMLSFVLASAFPPESVSKFLLTVLRALGRLYGFPELLGS
jgi:hypothetical protein